jgi:glycerol-3-phosphate dehydrogenase (NAD(P)+)
MMKKINNVVIVGAGSIGTAIGNVLARKDAYNIILLSIEKEVVESINNKRRNQKYFPNLKLSKHIKATTDINVLQNADIVFLAIPSNVIVGYIDDVKNILNPKAILLNMAKGFGPDNKIITESLKNITSNPVCAFKGPTFARELINRIPTAFTIGSKDESHFKLFSDLFEDTNIYIDFTNDIRGVEILSLLKNIYAIATGIVDAHFSSSNLRFLFLTKAFNEMREIMLNYGGMEGTLFKYCGFGDFCLTALNDLSRNRTLGLLIGKGFFVEDISDKVTLEGKIAVNVFCNEIKRRNQNCDYPIISELYKLFNEEYDDSKFVTRII